MSSQDRKKDTANARILSPDYEQDAGSDHALYADVYFILTDADKGNILGFSENFSRALGKSKEQIVRKNIADFGLIKKVDTEKSLLTSVLSENTFLPTETVSNNPETPFSRCTCTAHLLETDLELPTRVLWVIEDISRLQEWPESSKRELQNTEELISRLSCIGDIMHRLATIWELDAFCKAVVEEGRQKLGFEIISIWLYNENTDSMQGAFGTDSKGQTRDERAQRNDTWKIINDVKERMAESGTEGRLPPVTTSFHYKRPSIAVLHEGKKILGAITTRQGLSRRRTDSSTHLLLEVYATCVSYLLSRLRGAQDQALFGYLLEELHVISNKISRTESTRELLRSAVELGREKLGFERIGIWLFDRENDCLRGTFGTDEMGNTSDERGQTIPGWHAKIIGSKQSQKRYWDFDAGEIQELHEKYGYLPELAKAEFSAENVTAPLWSGEENLGMIAIDNYFSKEPIPNYRKDILALYARTIGHLYDRLAATEALNHSRKREKEFSKLLRELNSISKELSREHDLDTFCRKAIEMGLQHLGYERLSLWLYDHDTDSFSGTFGTDESGNIRDERHIRNRVMEGSGGRAVVESNQNLFVRQNAPLYGTSDITPIKNGPEAVAKLTDGSVTTGFLSSDSLFTGEMLDGNRQRILVLYAGTIGHLLSRLRSEESIRTFGERLERLHHITNRLSVCQTEEELWKKSIEYALEDLEFDRIALQIYHPVTKLLMCTWGADENGHLHDERGLACREWYDGDYVDRTSVPENNYVLLRNVDLYQACPASDSDGEVEAKYLGKGDNAKAILWDGKTAVGFLAIDNYLSQKPVSKNDLEILTLYASTLAYQIRSKRAENARRDFSNRLQILHEQSIQLQASPTVSELCRKAVQIGSRKLGFDRMAILLYDEKRDLMVGTWGVDMHFHVYDMESEETGHEISKRPNDPLSHVLRQRLPYAKVREKEVKESGEVFWLEKGLAALWDGNRAIGYIPFDKGRPDREVSEEDLELLAIYASTIGHILSEIRAKQERSKLESQVQHAQKLESLGVLAGGIAHDFNNLLMGILGNIDLALMELPATNNANRHLAECATAAHRAAELAQQMLAYSGKGKFIIEPLDMNQLIREMGHLLEVSIGKNALMRYSLAQSLPLVEGDATQLRQVIMNLITNASESLGDESGQISITTRKVHCDREYLDQLFINDNMTPGNYVAVEVSDTGCGMSLETIERVFEPFFTTKFTGRGLGMAAVMGIIRGHQGGIKIYSELGQGSCFKIFLPATKNRNGSSVYRNPAHLQEAFNFDGKVLLADDENVVLEVTGNMLEKAGFQVVKARDGRDAVKKFTALKDEINCVILDLTMPHMNGETAFQKIHQISPDTPVIMSSGYTESDVRHRFAGREIAGFIEKPYQMAQLMAILSKALQGKQEHEV